MKVEGDASKTSDCCHTFADLYRMRCLLFCIVARMNPRMSWKSFAHENGHEREGQFIAGIRTPKGNVNMHMPTAAFWNLLHGIEEKKCAPPHDGSTSEESMNRLEAWLIDGISLCFGSSVRARAIDHL